MSWQHYLLFIFGFGLFQTVSLILFVRARGPSQTLDQVLKGLDILRVMLPIGLGGIFVAIVFLDMLEAFGHYLWLPISAVTLWFFGLLVAEYVKQHWDKFK